MILTKTRKNLYKILFIRSVYIIDDIMDLTSDVNKTWQDEFEQFISHWEGETHSIMNRSLNNEECDNISALFTKGSDGLLLRKPVDISNDEIFSRLEQLNGKLGSILAMACTSSELETIKKF